MMNAPTRKRLGTNPARLNQNTRAPFIAYASLFLLGLLTAAAMETLHDYIRQWNLHELVRVTSTDGRVDAVFAQSVHGLFGEGSALYLVPKGDPVSPSDALFQGSAFKEPPRLRWQRPQLLQIAYSAGCISGFTNTWRSDIVEGGKYFVEIRLAPAGKFVCIDDKAKKVSPVAEASMHAESEKAR